MREPVQMTNQGPVRCCFCRTDHGDFALPPDDDRPMSEAHWGVRFRDNPATPLRFQMLHQGQVQILFNGDDVTARCLEYEEGAQGWVALYHEDGDGKRVRCGLGPHALAFMEHGQVTVYKRP